MIGVIDASMYKHIKSFPKDIQGLFYEQLAYCSVLFVNKIDSADVDTTSKLLKDLEVINPDADIQVYAWQSHFANISWPNDSNF